MISPLPKPPCPFPPKPILGPKPVRLPKGHGRMTLVAGFRLDRGGILICADREESNGVAKRSVDKIERFNLHSSSYVIAGAGSSPVLANALPRIRQSLQDAQKAGKDLPLEHQLVIQSSLRSLYEEMIWRRNDEADRNISLIIAASFGRYKGQIRTALYGNYDDTLYPANAYICEGCGRDLAYYLADKLYSGPYPNLPNRPQAIVQAAFIFKEVRESISGVGLGTDMLLVSGIEWGIRYIPHPEVKQLEKALPELREGIQLAWNKGLKIPDWIKQESPDSDLSDLPENGENLPK